jgi:L-alanine-DL-glutamate epimerase-like enolase superfamily enzyme
VKAGAAIRARMLAVPFSRTRESPNYHFTHLFTILCEVSGEGGQRGIAGLWFPRREQAAVVLEALRYLAPIASANADPHAAVPALRREMSFLGYKGVSVMAMSGLEMALFDLRLRTGEVVLPPRRRDRVRAYWSGFFLSETLDVWRADAEKAVGRGFTAFKARAGRPDLDEDDARIAALRAMLPADSVLMLDVNQAWDRDRAIAGARQFERHNLRWLEDPLVHYDYPGLAQMVRESPIPIATGENEYLPEGFRQVLDAGVTFLLADLERAGGITGWQAIAQLAAERGAVLTPHLYPHVAVQLCSRMEQEEQWLEYVDWWDPLMARSLTFVDGYAQVDDVPGTGFDPDPEAVERYATGSWEQLT